MIKIFLFCTILLTANLANAQTVIKMKRSGGVSLIPCKVNGLSLYFIFDTGASDVSISLTEAMFMLKNGYLNENDIKEKMQYSTADGTLHEGITINLKEMEIAGLKMFNVSASIVKNQNAPLLLGQSAISKLGKIQLDLTENTLTILSGKGSYDYTSYITNKDDLQKNTTSKKNIKFKSLSFIIGISSLFKGIPILKTSNVGDGKPKAVNSSLGAFQLSFNWQLKPDFDIFLRPSVTQYNSNAKVGYSGTSSSFNYIYRNESRTVISMQSGIMFKVGNSEKIKPYFAIGGGAIWSPNGPFAPAILAVAGIKKFRKSKNGFLVEAGYDNNSYIKVGYIVSTKK